MAATDALPVPRKNTAYRITFPIFDADGDLVTGATGLDSEVDLDAAGFADCTNEATEIGSSGMYYLDLTAAEMNADTVTIIVKTSTVGAKTTPIVLNPQEAGDIRVNTTEVGGTAQTAGDIIGDTNDIQARLPAALTGDGNMKADTLRIGGTLQTAGDVVGDTNDIQARLPAALTGDGNIKADTLRVGGTLQTAGDLVAILQVIDDYVDGIEVRLPANLTAPTGVISATPTIAEALAWVATLLRNKIEQTSDTQTLYADNGSTVIANSSTADDGSVFTRSEWA